MTESTTAPDAKRRRIEPSRCFAACTVAVGAGVLLGWALDIDVLKRVHPALITMKPNAALLFLLSGLAIWTIREGRPISRRAVGLSLLVALGGGATLLEYVAEVDLGIDELLFAEPPHAFGSIVKTRMHPMTALNFLTLGLASALLAADREHRAAQSLILLAVLIAGSTLVGYIYGVRTFEHLAAFNQMALHTTIGMLMVAAGLLTSRAHRGPMASLSEDGPSGLMARRLLPVAILTPLIIGGLTIAVRDLGMLDDRYASAVRVTLVVAIFVGCIWRSAHELYRLDLDRQAVEAGRAEAERRIRFLAEAMPQIVWVSGPDGTIEYLNRRWFDYTGHDPSALADWGSAMHPVDLSRCADLWARCTSSGDPFQGEYRLRRRDGQFRWHLSRAEPRRDASGSIVQWVGTSTDVHDQKRAGEERYRSLVEATTAIVWNTPPSGEFEADQPGWASYTGQSFEQLKGWGWIDAIHPEDRPDTARVWAAAVADRVVYQVMHRLRRHDGEYRHMVARAVPLIAEDGTVLEWFGVHTDVDDQERAHEAMRRAKEAAEAATRAKGEFLANMSHEIRTPMNGVLGMTELALATDLNPRQREYLGLVKSSADALLTVIDDILDFSKIEAGKLRLEPISFAPRELVTDALRALAIRAHPKGLELACRIAPGVPEALVGDPGRLRQVLLNLVGNAIKFTESGEVVVIVEVDPEAASPASLRFSVCDTGIGIPPEKRAAIFVPFEQADGSTTRKFGGTGLGLTISARLIEIMGGRIWVEENPGGGSVFRFTAALAAEGDGPPPPRPSTPIILDGLRILIVDDNRTNRMILEEVLSQWGCRPLAVPGATEALAALGRAADRNERFPLVLLDRMMPGMDGSALARQILEDPRHAGIRMMMLTSGGPDESARAVELGIGAWLAKPVRQSELLGAILDLIGQPRQAGPPPSAPAPVAGIVPAARPLRILLAEDHPINQKVAARMLQGQGHEVTIVGDGLAALAALQADRFDAALMDVQMPEMDGFEALAAIRARERAQGGHFPVIALTAHAMAGDRQRCLDAGFDAYLSKPIQGALLAEALAAVTPPAPAGPPGPKAPAFLEDQALQGLGGDASFLREILGIFLEEGPRLLAEVRQGITSGEAARLRILGHTLAGSASHCAAPDLIQAARKLEAIGKSGDLAGAEEAERALVDAFERFRESLEASRFAPSPARA